MGVLRRLFLISLLGLFWPIFSWAKCTLAIQVTGAITASTHDYLLRALKEAQKNSCESLLMEINTPGGSLQSTRLIVEEILASPIPILCLVSPEGGHAGSAGAIILQACHISGALATTNIGAATPVLGTGEKMTDDLRNKMINDTVSWLEGIIRLRERNLQFGRDIVEKAKAVDATEALKLKAIDVVPSSVEDFLKWAEGRKTKGKGGEPLTVAVGLVVSFEGDLKHKILQFVSDPEIAYLLFIGSLALLYFEITHPGTIVPGVVGAIGLILSMVSFHKLDVWWGGVALIILGILLMIAEIFVTSFGALGIGGAVAFVIGSVFLYDVQATGYVLPWPMIATVVIMLAGVLFGLGYLALSTFRLKPKKEFEHVGKVVQVEEGGLSGRVEIEGELWRFESDHALMVQDQVQVVKRSGLTLKVKKKE